MKASPSAGLAHQKARRTRKKSQGKKGVAANAAEGDANEEENDDLEYLKEKNVNEYAQPKKTKTEYERIRERAREWLPEYVKKRRAAADPQDAKINWNQYLKAFNKIPNRYSAHALELYLTEKCFRENCGSSTAMTTHAAWASEWDNAAGTKYKGAYNLDEETGDVSGCPARAVAVTQVVKAVKARDRKTGVAANRNHAEAVRIEDLQTIYNWSSSLHPASKTETVEAKEKLGDVLTHEMFRTFLAFGFLLWTRNFETCAMLRRHITLNCRGDGPNHDPYIRVFLENRKGWQNKKGWDGPLGSNTYHIYKQNVEPMDLHTHLLHWIATYESEIGRPLEANDVLFPDISSNGVINPKKEMSHKQVQSLLDDFAKGARLERRYTTHCLRRGGAQYRMMYAPLDERWTISRIRWWGGWAEGESLDTLMKYLLDSLQSYQNGHADALAPKPKTTSSSNPTTGCVTKADLKDLTTSLESALNSLALQAPVAPEPLSTAAEPSLNAAWFAKSASPTTAFVRLPVSGSTAAPTQMASPLTRLVPTMPQSMAALSQPTPNYMWVNQMNPNILNPTYIALNGPTVTQPHIHQSSFLPYASSSRPLGLESMGIPMFQPIFVHQPFSYSALVNENPRAPPSPSHVTPTEDEAMDERSDTTPIPVVQRHPDLPKAGLRIPDLPRNDSKAWLEAVRQWEEGIPGENIPPLRDWDSKDYRGGSRERFAMKRMYRQVIAEEYDRLKRSEKQFEKLYGHLRGIVAIVNEIKRKGGAIKRRRSKNGTPEERGAVE